MQHWLVAKKNFSTCWTLAVMPNVMVLCHILSERDDNTVEAPLMATSLQWQRSVPKVTFVEKFDCTQ